MYIVISKSAKPFQISRQWTRNCDFDKEIYGIDILLKINSKHA